jgi:hypothetical protein
MTETLLGTTRSVPFFVADPLGRAAVFLAVHELAGVRVAIVPFLVTGLEVWERTCTAPSVAVARRRICCHYFTSSATPLTAAAGTLCQCDPTNSSRQRSKLCAVLLSAVLTNRLDLFKLLSSIKLLLRKKLRDLMFGRLGWLAMPPATLA